MSDIFGSSQPDWSGDAQTSADMFNKIYGQMQPSQAAQNQTYAMANQMGNQAFNQGLSGSTIENQALGQGVSQTLSQDQMKQAQMAMGLLPGIEQGNMAAKMLPGQEMGQFLGMGTNMLSSLLPLMMG